MIADHGNPRPGHGSRLQCYDLTMSELVCVDRDAAGIARVTLNRPEARNALSRATCERLTAIARDLENDPGVRAVIITGAGDRAFCAGADLKERRGVSAAETAPYLAAIAGAIDAWARLPRPTLALVNGAAFGGGMELCLACDFRIAAASAVFALTEVRLGIMPGAGGTQRLPRLVGIAAAKELILLGRRIDAERARAMGLVMEVCAGNKLAAAGDNLMRELLLCAPKSVAQAKRAIDDGFDLPLEDALALERECYNVTLFSADRDEGLRAFAEKRPPQYTGR